MMDEQKEILAEIKRELDKSAESLDSDTLERLRASRNQALAREPARSGIGFWKWCTATVGQRGDGRGYTPAAYLLTSLAVVTVAGWFWLSQPGELQDLSALGNLDLLTAAEEPEFYEQLDFYLWLENETQG